MPSTFWRDLSPSAALAAVLALLVGYSGPFLIIVHAAQSAGLSPAQLGSWIWAVSIGSGVAGLWLSWRWKAPVITAWSTPARRCCWRPPRRALWRSGGAYLAAAAIVTLLGVSGLFDRLMKVFPAALAAAMLAGILFRFVAELAGAASHDPLLVVSMAALFFIGRRFFPRYALPAAILLGLLLAAAQGLFQPLPAHGGDGGPCSPRRNGRGAPSSTWRCRWRWWR